MRAGQLDREITIQAQTRTGTTPAGTPQFAWTTFATVRAQIVQASTQEYLRGYGETDNLGVVFRIWWLDGVTTEHRVHYAGKTLNIRETKEIDRRKGLELRCEEVRT
ncbi:phage head closure protein [Mesorhizobium sp. J428]|uniref:phage head closure protein n=1 Tax=Mesorhizobium sp. J428 TaxID=2898440 RepID=UPI002151634C|nr:phage head closure protein [Mesorhizobium sp. J428]MCR5856576.1 phage head closure protein [Mesorhizobium sp. J428]